MTWIHWLLPTPRLKTQHKEPSGYWSQGTHFEWHACSAIPRSVLTGIGTCQQKQEQRSAAILERRPMTPVLSAHLHQAPSPIMTFQGGTGWAIKRGHMFQVDSRSKNRRSSFWRQNTFTKEQGKNHPEESTQKGKANRMSKRQVNAGHRTRAYSLTI